MIKVPIYKSELEIIKRQECEDLRKLLYTILVWTKQSKYNNVPCDDRKIGKLSGLNYWKNKVADILSTVVTESEFTEGALLQIRFIEVQFGWFKPFYIVLYEETDKTKKPVFHSKGIYYSEIEYDKHIKEHRSCVECGVIITGRRRKYCASCSEVVRRNYIAKKRREYYRNQKKS